jgi:hypothetical protein
MNCRLHEAPITEPIPSQCTHIHFFNTRFNIIRQSMPKSTYYFLPIINKLKLRNKMPSNLCQNINNCSSKASYKN